MRQWPNHVEMETLKVSNDLVEVAYAIYWMVFKWI